ncbi:universal stress protein [Telmatospirillum sp.]|uniref:universal stress protein n=1 Tax=Telmatospirillum sp. TaxID=2079197 RepID=UPI002849B8DB|nr:universal stress protein [Telmatospirillum sp.]MDR3437759.1 universal stress protein [Telmatospirillum sp.]
MAFRDILVHVDDTKACPARLAVAVELARTYDAHLVGLHVRPQLHLPGGLAPDYGGELTRLQDEYNVEAAATARSLFDRAVGSADIASEWRNVMGDVIDTVALHARYADLVVVGQSDADTDDMGNDRHLADHLVLDAGTPVLVVPFVGTYTRVGRRVLVAWNASREATRAIGDAMPFLVRSESVKVLAINPRDGQSGHGDVVGADISLHLARHGVKAVCESLRAPDVGVGGMLLSRAADDGADLLVMGAYGRSRLRELVLGGATRHILYHMTIPVLLSH